jgi:3-isopropylmalate/(R)-2-methylmalate dehydratase small subunit
MKTIHGKIWRFGDAIDTDIIIPARYLTLPLGEMKEKAMEPLRPTFASDFERGGIIVAGKNFGCGSSREQAPAVLKALGVAAIAAESFARIFYRNAINLGLPLVECEGLSIHAREGETAEIDLSTGKVRLIEGGKEFPGTKLPDFLLEIIEDGGLVKNLTKDSARRGPPSDSQFRPHVNVKI